jgi:hypothetical protein
VPRFLPPDSYRDPVDNREAKGHGETARRYQVQIDGREVACHDERVSVASKKQGTSASAGSPIDFVSSAGSVKVQQYFISWLNFSLIDF